MNRNIATTAPRTATRIARLAWLCAFALPLVLATALLGVKSTQAQAPQPAVIPFALDEFEEEELALEDEEELEEEEEEAGFAETECEIAEEEAEEGEIPQSAADALCREAEEFAEAGRSAATAGRCPIRSARAHASLKRHKLKVTVGYTTSAPTKAAIQIPRVGTFKRRLGRSGVIRIARKLGKRRPGRIVVRIRAPFCAKLRAISTRVR